MSDSKSGLLGLGSHGPAVADVRARLAALPLDQLPSLRTRRTRRCDVGGWPTVSTRRCSTRPSSGPCGPSSSTRA